VNRQLGAAPRDREDGAPHGRAIVRDHADADREKQVVPVILARTHLRRDRLRADRLRQDRV
jgi:hypothetical protein